MTRPIETRLALLAASLLLSAGAAGCAAGATQAPGSAPTEPPAPASLAPAISVAPGNSVALAVPDDVPAPVTSKVAAPTCGATISFEVDPDVSPAPTLPAGLTTSHQNDAATGCLLSAWRARQPAVLWTDEATDEQDQIFTIYRLPGDGTVDVIVRLDSHTEKTVTWTETTCRDLTLQDGRVTPADCDSEVQIH